MEYPWLGEYKACGIPRTLEPYPEEPTHFLLDRSAERYPRMGCVQLELELSYREVKEHADRLAYALSELGVDKGDRVATLLPTSLQYVIADAGISKAGGAHVPCSFLEAQESLARKFAQCTPKALICLDQYFHLAEQLRDFMGEMLLLVTALEDYSAKKPSRARFPGALWLTEVIDQAKPVPPRVKIEPSRDLETVIFTGGTTGVAKGCMLTHRNVIANAMQNPSVFGPVRKVFRGNMSVLMGNPFFHSYGHSVMHTMIGEGYNMLLVVDPRDYRSMLDLAKRYNPVLQVGLPTQFMKLMEEEGRAKVIGISGAAPLPPSVQEKYSQSGRGFISEGYGLSELTAVSHFNVSANIRAMGGRRMMRMLNSLVFNAVGVALFRGVARLVGPRRFGRFFLAQMNLLGKLPMLSRKARGIEKRATIGIPLPDTEVKVVEVETEEPIPWEKLSREELVGEMLLKGPQTMLGYWPEPGKGLDSQGFVHTGDVVKMDSQGYFSIVDRTKDMIIVSGFKVYTREVDDILYDHPATEVAATVGVPDPDRPGSERVKVFVQLKEDYRGKVSEEDLLAYLRERVAKYALPRAVVFLEEMPLTEVGKVNKKALREMEMKEWEENRS